MAYDSAYLGNTMYAGSKGACQIYVLDTVDVIATVLVAGYISDATLRGMQLGDPVLVRRFNALPTKTSVAGMTWCVVSAISAAGAATLIVFASA